jgi:hypothetical protein
MLQNTLISQPHRCLYRLSVSATRFVVVPDERKWLIWSLPTYYLCGSSGPPPHARGRKATPSKYAFPAPKATACLRLQRGGGGGGGPPPPRPRGAPRGQAGPGGGGGGGGGPSPGPAIGLTRCCMPDAGTYWITGVVVCRTYDFPGHNGILLADSHKDVYVRVVMSVDRSSASTHRMSVSLYSFFKYRDQYIVRT